MSDREAIHDIAVVQQLTGFVGDSVLSAPLCDLDRSLCGRVLNASPS